MFFESEFMKLYAKLSNINENTTNRLHEGKKQHKASKTQTTLKDCSTEMDDFLRSIGLVRISEISPICKDFSNFSPTGTAIWAPDTNYEEDVPNFNILATKHLHKFANELPSVDYPLPKWAPKPVQNNGKRNLYSVDLGAIGSNQWRGLWFRTKVQDKTYFIFGRIFYKGYQKVNASTNRDVSIANTFYDKVIEKVEKFNEK